MIIWMLINALVFAKAPFSLVPKSRTKFFGNEGLVPLIHLGESNWVSWFPKDQVATLNLFSQTKCISKGFQNQNPRKHFSYFSKTKRKTALSLFLLKRKGTGGAGESPVSTLKTPRIGIL